MGHQRGRPPLDPNDPSVPVNIAFTSSHYAEMLTSAKSENVSVQTIIRRCVTAMLAGYDPPVSTPPNDLIQSDRDKIIVARGERVHHRPHVYVGGRPSRRLIAMQLSHEVRCRKAGVPWDIVDLRLVFEKGNGLCGICKKPVGLDEFTVDHVVPISKGGAHRLSNLQPAHFLCNSKKGDR